MDNRRSFLKKAGLLSTALIAGNSAIGSAMEYFEPGNVREIGLQLFTVRDALAKDVRSTIEKIAKIGYQHIETFYNYKAGEKPDFWGLSPADFHKLQVQHALKSYSGHYQLNDFLTKGNGDDKAFKFQLDIAANLRQQYMIVPIPPLALWDKLTRSDYQYMAEQLNKAGEISKKSNVKIGYHNHFWEFRDLGKGERGYDILLKETDPKLVAFEMDLFWIEKSGIQPVDYFNKYPHRFPMWHVKDMDKANVAKITGPAFDHKESKDIFSGISYAEVGTGAINYKPLFKNQQQKSGLQHIFVEQDVIRIDPFISIKESYTYVKNNLLKPARK